VASSRPEDLAGTVEALGNVVPSGPQSIELFVSVLRSGSADTKQRSLKALSKSGKNASAALPMMRQLAEDPNESETTKRLAREAIKNLEPRSH